MVKTTNKMSKISGKDIVDNKKSKLQEYSKRCIAAMIILWFIVAIYGMVVEIILLFKNPELVSLEGLFGYVGIPMTGGIVGYLIKSAVENKTKIKGNISSNEEILEQVYEKEEEEEDE